MRPTPLIASAALAAAMTAVLPAGMAAAASTRHEAEVTPATCDGTIDSNHSGYSGSGRPRVSGGS